jgi:hydrogenase expression/formation protein HypE
LYKFNIWTTFQRSGQGNDHYVERVKEAIWLLPEGPYSADIGKGIVAQEKKVLLKTGFGGDRIVDIMVGVQQPKIF